MEFIKNILDGITARLSGDVTTQKLSRSSDIALAVLIIAFVSMIILPVLLPLTNYIVGFIIFLIIVIALFLAIGNIAKRMTKLAGQTDSQALAALILTKRIVRKDT
jgi:type III secretory pathway component EscV